MRVGAIIVCSSLFAACGGDSERLPLPQVTSFGGPIMAHPQLVPIFYNDDPDATTLTSFSRWLVTSDWLAEVGTEYGVGPGSVLGTVQLPMPAPTSITDAQVVDMVFQGVTSGSLPRPADGNLGDVLYVLHLPAQTVETAGDESSCVDFGGYHGAARRNGVELSYAVIATCPQNHRGLTNAEFRELVLSHELIEAATDPLPGNHPAYVLNDRTSPWSSTGGEVGDLCELSGQQVWRDSGYVVQRSWSNIAAESGDPCVPVPANTVYFNLKVGGMFPPRIPAGGHQTVQITGWSTGKMADWTVEAAPARSGEVTLALGATQLNAGKTTTLDVAFPATAQPGDIALFYLFSVLPDQKTYEVLPMRAIVGAPCASFTGCQACTSQPGCGFCATTGRCENIGASGSADSSCPAASFAQGLGDCPGYCAAHNGSCVDCASQPGCGWCDAGAASQCVSVDHKTLLPANNACSYASWDLTPDYCPMP
ncbi:MAG TPA: hypothetical protein VF469_28865 [Kofleriaceae bacterium]